MGRGCLSYLEACSRVAAGMPDAQTPEALAHMGKALLDAGCTDPMVEYNYGLDLLNCARSRAAKPYLLRAVAGFRRCHYPRARSCFAPMRLAQIDGDELTATSHTPQPELAREQNAMKSLALQWLGESLRDGSFTGSDRRVFFELITDDDFTDGEVLDMLHATPGADPYLLNVFEGRQEYDACWKTHGNVRNRNQHLQAARQKLTTAWKQHPELPEAPSDMILVTAMSNETSGETPYTWFNRVMSAQMDYLPAYHELLWARRPLMDGSYEEMYRVGLACLATRRFDTSVPEGFFYAVHEISDDEHGSLEYWHRPETYQHLQTLFDGYLKAPQPPREQNLYRSWYAASAYLCGHYDNAQRMLDKLGHNAQEKPFRLFAHCSFTAHTRIKLRQPPDLRKLRDALH